jgi:hypothetical protein
VGQGDVPPPPRALGRDPGLTSSEAERGANRTLGSPRGPLRRCRPRAPPYLVLRTAPMAPASLHGRPARAPPRHQLLTRARAADTTTALERASSYAATYRAEESSYQTFTAPAVGPIRAREQLLAGSLLRAAGMRLHPIGVLADAGTVEKQRCQSGVLLVVHLSSDRADPQPSAIHAGAEGEGGGAARQMKRTRPGPNSV